MEDKYIIYQKQGITIVEFIKKPGYDDLVVLLEHLASKELYRQRIYDFTRTGFDFSSSELMSLARLGKMMLPDPNWGAIVTTSDLTFAEGRQFSAFREESTDISAFRVFRTIETAIQWLQGKAGSAPKSS